METLVQTNAVTLLDLLYVELHRTDCPLTLDAFFQQWQAQCREQQGQGWHKDDNAARSVECDD